MSAVMLNGRNLARRSPAPGLKFLCRADEFQPVCFVLFRRVLPELAAKGEVISVRGSHQ